MRHHCVTRLTIAVSAVTVASCGVALTACAGGHAAVSSSGATVSSTAPTTAATTTTIAVTTTTEAPTTTPPPECVIGATENRNVTAAGYDIYRCTDGKWEFMRTATTALTPPVIMDQATVDWWLLQPEDFRQLACGYGYNVVSDGSLDRPTFEYLCKGGKLEVEARTGDELTIDEIDAALSPPAKAWARKPSSDSYAKLAAAAQALADTLRPFPSSDALTADVALHMVRSLITYPGDDATVALTFDHLRPIMPNAPLVLDTGGHTVGTDAFPGTYRTTGQVESCYWETLNEAGEINANNFVDAAPQVIMTIRQRDFAENSEDCGIWIQQS